MKSVYEVDGLEKPRLIWLKPELQVLEISEMTNGKSHITAREYDAHVGPS